MVDKEAHSVADDTDYLISDNPTTITQMDIIVSGDTSMSEFRNRLDSVIRVEFSPNSVVCNDVSVYKEEQDKVCVILTVIENDTLGTDIEINDSSNVRPADLLYDDVSVHEWFIEDGNTTLVS